MQLIERLARAGHRAPSACPTMSTSFSAPLPASAPTSSRPPRSSGTARSSARKFPCMACWWISRPASSNGWSTATRTLKSPAMPPSRSPLLPGLIGNVQSFKIGDFRKLSEAKMGELAATRPGGSSRSPAAPFARPAPRPPLAPRIPFAPADKAQAAFPPRARLNLAS